MNLILGNIDYEQHTTDEGDQFQRGLAAAGWQLAGPGYGDGCADVPTLLERFQPEAVIVHDKRDWSPDSPGSFRKDLGYQRLWQLRTRPDIFRAGILKDAGSSTAYHRSFFHEIDADAGIAYYALPTVRRLNSWLGSRRQLLRVYHSVDASLCAELDLAGERRRAVVTGACSGAYPLRSKLFKLAAAGAAPGIEAIGHPGYHNRGSHTPAYLRLLTGFKVHVATASRFGFALRKIIESVACGATPVTNLPCEDVLPEIDGALVRIAPDAGIAELLAAVERAAAAWNLAERMEWARKAWSFYDWRAAGLRLAGEIEALLAQRRAA